MPVTKLTQLEFADGVCIQKERFMRNSLKIIAFLTIFAFPLLLFAGCLSDAQKQEEKELLAKYSPEFKTQAELQYGAGAKVSSIQIETKDGAAAHLPNA